MKLSNLLKSLDVRGIAKDLQYLFERIDDNFAKVKGAFDNRISLMDNIECDIVEGVFDSGKEYAVRLKNLSTAKGAIVLSSTAPCIATPVVKTAAGAAKITLFFAQMASGVRATIVLFPYGVGGNQTNSLLATNTTPGLIQPDGTTVTIDDAGVISSAGGASVITTQGDLIRGDVAGNEERLPIGAANTVLTSDGTTESWQPAGGGTLVNSGTSVVDFGAFPGTAEATFAVVDAAITGTCVATGVVAYAATGDHTVSDHAYAARLIDITTSVVAGTITFYVRCLDTLQGTFNIRWMWFEPNGAPSSGGSSYGTWDPVLLKRRILGQAAGPGTGSMTILGTTIAITHFGAGVRGNGVLNSRSAYFETIAAGAGDTGQEFLLSITRFTHRPKLEWLIRAPASLLTKRLKMTLESGGPPLIIIGAGASAAIWIGVAFASDAANGNWWVTTGDGTNYSSVDTGVAVVVDTDYRIVLDFSVAGTLTTRIYSGPLQILAYTGVKATNLPTAAADVSLGIVDENLSGAVADLGFYRSAFVLEDGQ